jgi:hypothetical protein
MPKSSRLDIQDMANLLEMRKNNNHPTVLLLGARAGRLFHSMHFSETLLPFSKRDFHQLSRIKQFQECYSILTNDNKLSERDLHSILQESLKNLPITNADICLASLIRHQYFDEIISTNIDEVIDDALAQTEMKAGRDYQIMQVGRNPLQDEKNCFCRIIKVHGDVLSRNYTDLRERASRLENAELRSFLQKLLGKDLLTVGIDPIWDQDILRIIPVTTNGGLWLVSEEKDIVDKSPDLAGLLQKRSSACILGHEGSYDSFIPKIHNHLHGSNFSNYQQYIAKRVDLLPSMEEKLTNLMMMLDTMTEQLTHLTTALSAMNDQLQTQQNENQILFNEVFREIQQIYKKLEEIGGDREAFT